MQCTMHLTVLLPSLINRGNTQVYVIIFTQHPPDIGTLQKMVIKVAPIWLDFNLWPNRCATKVTNFMKHLCPNIQTLQCLINLTDLQGLQGALYGQKSISCNTQTYPDIPYKITILYSKAKEAFINPQKTHFAIIHFFEAPCML